MPNLLGKIRKKLSMQIKSALLHWTSKSCELLYMYMHPKLKQCWLSYASLSKHIALLANFPTIIHQCLKPNHTWSNDVGSLSVHWLSCTFHVKFNSFSCLSEATTFGKVIRLILYKETVSGSFHENFIFRQNHPKLKVRIIKGKKSYIFCNYFKFT